MSQLGGSPTRLSTLTDIALVRQFPEYITLREQLRYSDPDWRPIIAEWDDINTKFLGVAISDALKGKKTPAQALNDMVPKVSELMRTSGHLKA